MMFGDLLTTTHLSQSESEHTLLDAFDTIFTPSNDASQQAEVFESLMVEAEANNPEKPPQTSGEFDVFFISDSSTIFSVGTANVEFEGA